jgi:hypothetical protein
MASMAHAAQAPWLEQAKDLVAQDFPVIMLMMWTPVAGSGNHYRVMIGYDDVAGTVTFVDPWYSNVIEKNIQYCRAGCVCVASIRFALFNSRTWRLMCSVTRTAPTRGALPTPSSCGARGDTGVH